MKKSLKTVGAMLCIAISPLAYASDDDHDHHDHHHHGAERQKHFNVTEPDGWQEALEVLRVKGDAMQLAYDKQDYATMHELSYHLEIAADVLQEEAGELIAAVEAVHHSTEDGEMNKLAEAFPELKERLDALKTQ